MKFFLITFILFTACSLSVLFSLVSYIIALATKKYSIAVPAAVFQFVSSTLLTLLLLAYMIFFLSFADDINKLSLFTGESKIMESYYMLIIVLIGIMCFPIAMMRSSNNLLKNKKNTTLATIITHENGKFELSEPNAAEMANLFTHKIVERWVVGKLLDSKRTKYTDVIKPPAVDLHNARVLRYKNKTIALGIFSASNSYNHVYMAKEGASEDLLTLMKEDLDETYI